MRSTSALDLQQSTQTQTIKDMSEDVPQWSSQSLRRCPLAPRPTHTQNSSTCLRVRDNVRVTMFPLTALAYCGQKVLKDASLTLTLEQSG